VLARIGTAAVAIAAVVLVVSSAPPWLFALVLAALVVQGYREFAALACAHGIRPFTPLGAAFAALASISPWIVRSSEVPDHYAVAWINLPDPLFLAMLVTFTALLVSRRDLKEALPSVACTVFGVVWLGLLGSYLGLVRDAGDGDSLLYTLLFAVWLGDSAALFVGKLIGKHKLAPRVSPGKTVEGVAGQLAGSALGVAAGRALFFSDLAPVLAWTDVFLLGALLAGASILGDLAESALKRGAGVKDAGGLFPGHGGVLDRIDSLLFAAPVMYYYSIWIG
jgi:phosphatidate cytidylyltransferase